MESLEHLRERLAARFPDAALSVLPNPGPAAQHSLLVGPSTSLVDLARFLRDDPDLRLDYCSNVTGIDWPEREIVETTKVEVAQPDGSTKTVEQKTKRSLPAYLEVVYHLYSMALGHGPLILRQRTANRTDHVTVTSFTPVWRSCEFQEREVFDLFGVQFAGHPDLRRILMWDGFAGFPMRKDYVSPDDFEWEPTAHDEVLTRAQAHVSKANPVVPPGGAS